MLIMSSVNNLLSYIAKQGHCLQVMGKNGWQGSKESLEMLGTRSGNSPGEVDIGLYQE